jgi:hypothetical protein
MVNAGKKDAIVVSMDPRDKELLYDVDAQL